MRYLAEKLMGKRQIISKMSRLKTCTINPKHFTIKSERAGVLIKVDGQKIKTIEIPCCKGEFKNMQRPTVSALNFAISLVFYIPEFALAETLKLIQNMGNGEPKKVEELLREDSLQMKVKMHGLEKLWDFTIVLSDDKKEGVHGEDYFVQITGMEEID